MNISDIRSDRKLAVRKKGARKKEKRRKQGKVRRRKNALRRVLDRRGKLKRFDPRNDIPPTLIPLFESVYAQIVTLMTNPIGPGPMHSSHATSFLKKLELGDVSGVAEIIQLYSNGGTLSSIFSSEWTFFNEAIKIRKPNFEELRMSECAARLYNTFYRRLAERLVKNRKNILQLKRDNLSTFRSVLFSIPACLIALVWIIWTLSKHKT